MDSESDPPITPPAVVKRKYHKRTHPQNRQYNLGRALKMRLEQHLSYADIARALVVPIATITKALRPLERLIEHPELTVAAKENWGALLDSAQVRVLSSMMDEDKLAKASLNNAAFALSKLHEMGRLERGETTSNSGVLVKILSDAHALLPTKLKDMKLIE